MDHVSLGVKVGYFLVGAFFSSVSTVVAIVLLNDFINRRK